MKIIISDIQKGSIADELALRAGDEIVSINNSVPRDIIDYSFLVQDEEIELYIRHKNGE